MTHLYRIKLVPDSAPNSEGRWIDVKKDREAPPGNYWLNIVTFFHSDTPKGEQRFHLHHRRRAGQADCATAGHPWGNRGRNRLPG